MQYFLGVIGFESHHTRYFPPTKHWIPCKQHTFLFFLYLLTFDIIRKLIILRIKILPLHFATFYVNENLISPCPSLLASLAPVDDELLSVTRSLQLNHAKTSLCSQILGLKWLCQKPYTFLFNTIFALVFWALVKVLCWLTNTRHCLTIHYEKDLSIRAVVKPGQNV